MPKNIIDPTGWPFRWSPTPATKAGNFVHVSGTLAIDDAQDKSGRRRDRPDTTFLRPSRRDAGLVKPEFLVEITSIASL